MENGRKFKQNAGFGSDFWSFQPLRDPIILPNGRVINPGDPKRVESSPVPRTSARQHRNSGQRKGR